MDGVFGMGDGSIRLTAAAAVLLGALAWLPSAAADCAPDDPACAPSGGDPGAPQPASPPKDGVASENGTASPAPGNGTSPSPNGTAPPPSGSPPTQATGPLGPCVGNRTCETQAKTEAAAYHGARARPLDAMAALGSTTTCKPVSFTGGKPELGWDPILGIVRVNQCTFGMLLPNSSTQLPPLSRGG